MPSMESQLVERMRELAVQENARMNRDRLRATSPFFQPKRDEKARSKPRKSAEDRLVDRIVKRVLEEISDADVGVFKSGPSHRQAKMTNVLRRVCEQHAVNEADVLDRSRGPKPVSDARQEIMRCLLDMKFGYAEIGRFLNRDHTSVLHGVKAATERNLGLRR